MSPSICILTPVYNGWKYLHQCAASIFAQEQGKVPFEWEWWIGINGHGPTGGEAYRLALALAQKDRRIRAVNLEDVNGKVEALNRLVQLSAIAGAPWIALLDCDDLWAPDKLAKQWDLLAKDASGADGIGTFCYYFGDLQGIGPTGLPSGWIDTRKEAMLSANPILNSSALLKRGCAEWEDRFGLEDYDLWIRLAAEGKKLYNIPERLLFHRIHKDSAFNGKGGQDLDGLLEYWKKRWLPLPQPQLLPSQQPFATVVSAFYPISSKFPTTTYIEWISGFWTKLHCPLVFYTTPVFLPLFQTLFADRPGPTKVIAIPFKELAAFNKLSPYVWLDAKQKDPEILTNHTPELYAIWYEKKEFVERAIQANPFQTDTFVWCDAGICRYPEWVPLLANRFPLASKVPRGKMCLLQIQPFQKEDTTPDPKDGIQGNFGSRNSIGGGILASDVEGWRAWNKAYDAMLMRYYISGRFIGKDQHIMGSLVLETPSLAHLVQPYKSFTSMQQWFSLLFYLADL